jgi:hypothetical protein
LNMFLKRRYNRFITSLILETSLFERELSPHEKMNCA